MTRVQRSALLPYSAAQMYRLVNDVDAYPEFVPWCVGCDVGTATAHEKQATLHFAKGRFKASLTTRNELIENRKITMHLVNGPFRHLTGIWKFRELDTNTCKAELDMEFAFSSRLYEFTLGPIFSQLANRMIAVFQQRAEDTCGKQ